jgi:hypothetical protein
MLDEMKQCTVQLVAPEFVAERQPVAIAIVIRNTSDKSLDLHLQGREIDFDVLVTGERGRLVWQRQEDFTQAILRLETLAPGASIWLEDVWDQTDSSGQPVEPGSYTIRGIVPTDGEPLLTQDHVVFVSER